MKVITQGAQFGRIVKVEIRNYTTNQKFIFDNNLRIDFTFFKTVDQVSEASLGQVKIYGLTQKTFSEINSTGGELELQFGYQGTEVQTLFIATITTMHPEWSQDGLCAVINVSANYADYMYTKINISATKEQTIYSTLLEFSKNFDLSEVKFLIEHPDEKERTNVANFVTQGRIYFSAHDYALSVLKEFAKKFELSISIEPNSEGEKNFTKDGALIGRNSHLLVKIRPEFLPAYIIRSGLPYTKANWVQSDVNENNIAFLKSFEEDSNNEQAFILNQYTGLLGYPKEEYKIHSVPASWNVAASEQITRKGQETIMTNAQKKKEADAKYAEKVKKATEKDKLDKLKPQKATRQANIQIKRRYLRVTALLNPSVKPQTQLDIQSNLDVYSGIVRVRTATYQGTNGSGSCTMELYCEDTTRKSDQQATDQDIKTLGSEFENQTIEGGVGDPVEGDGVTSGVVEE